MNIEDLKNISVVDEPQFDIALKWLGFAITFVVMLLILIYVSSYFSRKTGRYIHPKHERGIRLSDYKSQPGYKSHPGYKSPIDQQQSRIGVFNDEYEYDTNEY